MRMYQLKDSHITLYVEVSELILLPYNCLRTCKIYNLEVIKTRVVLLTRSDPLQCWTHSYKRQHTHVNQFFLTDNIPGRKSVCVLSYIAVGSAVKKTTKNTCLVINKLPRIILSIKYSNVKFTSMIT